MRLTETDFRTTCKSLDENGITIFKAEYFEDSFGSWYIEVSGQHRRRLSWDGRECWLYVEEFIGSGFNGWQDVWIDREPNEQSIEQALVQLRS